MNNLSLSVLNTLFNDGVINARSAYIRMKSDYEDIFNMIIDNPKEMCTTHPHMFDLFSAVLEIDDELKYHQSNRENMQCQQPTNFPQEL